MTVTKKKKRNKGYGKISDECIISFLSGSMPFLIQSSIGSVAAAKRHIMVRGVGHGFHFENAPGQSTPFQTKNAGRLGFHMVWFLGLAFALPFIAMKFQLSKKGL